MVVTIIIIISKCNLYKIITIIITITTILLITDKAKAEISYHVIVLIYYLVMVDKLVN